jgi:hypothetical protein
MTPEVCTAAVGSVANTGVGGVWALVVLAACCLLAGAVVLLVARRHPRGAAGVATFAAVALFASVVLSPSLPARAAAGPTVEYGACTLVGLEVSPEQAAWDAALALQPGDELVVLSVHVRGLSASPLELAFAAAVDDGALADGLDVSLRVDGAAAASVQIAPGGAVEVEVVLSLPPSTGNAVQGATGGMTFSVTATEV